MSNRLYLASRKPGIGARVNSRHPLANGLVFAYLFTEGSGGTRNLIRATDNLALDNGSWAVTPEGLAGIANGWNGFTNSTPTLAVRPAYLKTLLWAGVILGDCPDLTNAPPLFAHYYDTAATAPFNCGSIHRFNGQGDILFAWNNGTFASQTVNGIIPGYNVPVQFALVLDGTQASMYLNGQLVSTSLSNIPTAGSPILYAAGSYATFGVHPASSVNVNAAASMILQWDRPLSQAELLAIRDEPYKLFFPYPSIILGVAGPAGVSGAWLGSGAARSSNAGAKAASSAIAARAGVRATASGIKSISAPIGARAGADAISTGRLQAQSSVAARAGQRASAAGAQGTARPGLTGTSGARAVALGRMQASSTIAARVGADALSAGREQASGGLAARAAARASASGAQSALPHDLTAHVGARASATGAKGGLSSIAATTGARGATGLQKRAVGAVAARLGAEAVVVGAHVARSTILGRLGQRARATGGAGEQPVDIARRALIVPPRELVGAVAGRGTLEVSEG